MLGTGLLAALAAYGQTSLNSSANPVYANHVYGFQVTLPPGVTYTRTLPPNPDHGIGIALPDRTKVWVDASYTDSSSTEEEAGKQAADCRVEQKKETSLGSLSALLIRFSRHASADERAYEGQFVLSVYRSDHRAPVCYQIGIRATNGRISAQADDLFWKLVAGFSLSR